MDRDSKLFVNEIAKRSVSLLNYRLKKNQDFLGTSESIFNFRDPYSQLLIKLKGMVSETLTYANKSYLLSGLDFEKYVNFSNVFPYNSEGDEEDMLYAIRHILERVSAGFGTAIDFLLYLYLLDKKYPQYNLDIKKLSLKCANTNINNISEIQEWIGIDSNSLLPVANSPMLRGLPIPKQSREKHGGCPILLDKSGILDFLIKIIDFYYQKHILPYIGNLNKSFFIKEEVWIFLKED